MVMTPSTPTSRIFVVGSFIHAQCWIMTALPDIDQTCHADSYLRECAGKGLAVAVGAHRLGAAVDVLLGIGDDRAGDEVLKLLEHEGIAHTLVQRFDGASGQGCGLVDAQGRLMIAIHAGANQRLTPQHVQQAQAAIARARLVYAQCEAPLNVVTTALALGHAAGAITVLNPSPWPTEPAGSATFSALFAHAQVLVVNRTESHALQRTFAPDDTPTHNAPPAQATTTPWQKLWSVWPGHWLVITLGAEGCEAYGRNGEHLFRSAHPVAGHHPIGAGDAFAAGLCTALAQGLSMAAALRCANACGALAASHPGIICDLPDWQALHPLLTPSG